jgi:hypothetical protein
MLYAITTESHRTRIHLAATTENVTEPITALFHAEKKSLRLVPYT